MPEIIESDITPEMKISFESSTNPIPFGGIWHEIYLKQNCQFILKFINDLLFHELLKNVNHFQLFLSLSKYKPVFHDEIVLKSSNLFLNVAGSKYYEPITLLYRKSFTGQIKEDNLHREYLLKYDDVKDKYSDIMNKWFLLNEDLKPAFDLLYGNIFNYSTSSVNKFLNMAQAVETFHAILKDYNLFSQQEWKERIKNITELLDENLKSWIKNELAFSNRPKLIDRLKKLFEDFPKDMFKKIIEDHEKFCINVKNTRNYYTHYPKKLSKKAYKGSDLYSLTEKLKIFFICCLLKEIGLNQDVIIKVLERYKHYNM